MTSSGFTAKKTAARLAATQVLYSCDIVGAYEAPATYVAEFLAYNCPDKPDNSPDQKWLLHIVEGVCHKRGEIDVLLTEHLAENWKLERLDHVLRALLRVAVYELIGCHDVPHKVVINEYMAVARLFFQGEELGFINGILDQIAKKVRGDI